MTVYFLFVFVYTRPEKNVKLTENRCAQSDRLRSDDGAIRLYTNRKRFTVRTISTLLLITRWTWRGQSSWCRRCGQKQIHRSIRLCRETTSGRHEFDQPPLSQRLRRYPSGRFRGDDRLGKTVNRSDGYENEKNWRLVKKKRVKIPTRFPDRVNRREKAGESFHVFFSTGPVSIDCR